MLERNLYIHNNFASPPCTNHIFAAGPTRLYPHVAHLTLYTGRWVCIYVWLFDIYYFSHYKKLIKNRGNSSWTCVSGSQVFFVQHSYNVFIHHRFWLNQNIFWLMLTGSCMKNHSTKWLQIKIQACVTLPLHPLLCLLDPFNITTFLGWR